MIRICFNPPLYRADRSRLASSIALLPSPQVLVSRRLTENIA